MKIACRDLVSLLSDNPSVSEVSEKLFQLGHEHEINGEFFELELTPNRGDCQSLVGLARDLNPFYELTNTPKIFDGDINELDIEFENLSIDDCPRISFLEIEVLDTKVKYEPYLENYFKNYGKKSINLFTDISNYLSHECGQPTHCYDKEKITNKIIFEFKETNTDFKTLLGQTLKLEGRNCVFSSGNKVINLAGVMGGIQTACSNKTKKVLIECAYFRPESIIGKSIKYNLHSDASHKFERGVDISAQEKTLRRFIQIVKDHTQIKNLKIKTYDYLRERKNSLKIDVDHVNKILGTDISKKEYIARLEKLHFDVADKIYPPVFRHDIQTQNDLSEEIARSIGYDNIKSKKFPKLKKNANINQSKVQLLRYFFRENGFNEVINYPFNDDESTSAINIDNPLDSSKSRMRTDLRSSLLENLIYNQRRQKESIKLFEISDIYTVNDKRTMVGVIASGKVGKNFRDFSKKIDRKYLNDIFSQLQIEFNIDEILKDELGTKQNLNAYFFEFEIDNLLVGKIDDYSKAKKEIDFIEYKKISEYPSSSRDFSFLIKNTSKVSEVIKYLEDINTKNLRESFMFDFYINEKTEEVKIGYRFTFQSHEKTHTEEDISNLVKDMLLPILELEDVSIPGLEF